MVVRFCVGNFREDLRKMLGMSLASIEFRWNSYFERYLQEFKKRKAIEKNLGIEEVRKVKGYNAEVKTRMDVVKAIARGEADVGLTTYWTAK